MSYVLPGISLLLAFVAITVGFLAAPAIWKLRQRYNPEAKLATPADLWLCALTRCPCLTLIFGILLPCTFGLCGAAASGFSVNVNLDFAEYLEAELEVQYLLNVATEASLEQVRKPFSTSVQQTFNGWSVRRYQNRLSANSQDVVEPNDGSASPRGLQYEGVPLIYRLWNLDIFYEAVDPEKGIFTEEALNEIRDFENKLVSFPEYSNFCRRFESYGGLPCDVPSSVKNIFFTMPNASSGSMDLVYDGSGNLGNIELALEELAREEVRWWTDGDFNSKNLKSRYTRSTFYGGAPLVGYTLWADRNAEQEAKIYDFLGLLFKDYLRRADVPETDPIRLPYKHIYITWYEKRMQNYEILHYLWFDMLFAFGTLATVTFMVLMRFQNIFITFFAAVGVLLAFVASYYFHFIAGFTSLSLLDFVSFFVIMGIAADDVFLMYNAYQLAANILGDVDPKAKMIWAFKEAAAAMLVTSVTTCGSFYANCFSVIKVVRSFGFFMASVVVWNFINVLTIFPSAILVNELYIIPHSPCSHWRFKGAAYAPKQHRDNVEAALRIHCKQELRCFGIGKCLWPCISWARWFLLSGSMVLSLICLILAAESFKISEGEIQIFEEDLNLGRLQKLRKEVFPDAPGDYEKALEVNPPGRTVRVDACPGQMNGTWCSGQGTCDTSTSSCRCDDGFVGQGCSVRRANGSIELVYLSASDLFEIAGTPLQDFDCIHAHVLASPLLTEVPTTTSGSIDFFMLNRGDDPVVWQLAMEGTDFPWFSLSSTEGTVMPRSFSRTDEMYLGRDAFAGSLDLSRKPVAWQGSTTLTLSTAERSQQISIGAFVVPPASLTQLLVSEWNSGVPPASPVPVQLQPTFSVAYGFSANTSQNLLLQTLNIHYEVEVHSAEILVQAEAELVAEPLRKALYVVMLDGLPRSSTLVTVPQDMPRIITIQVISAFQSTTYTLRASRNCDGPCTTTAVTTTFFTETTIPGATTWTVSTTTSSMTTTQDFDVVVGLLTLDVLNCPALQSVEGAKTRTALATSIAAIAQVDVTATKVDLWCGRRLGDTVDRRLQKVGAEMRYTIATENSLTASVATRLREETEQSMTQKLQASLDDIPSLVVQLEVLSLQPPEVNPDSTSTVTLTSTRSSVTTVTTSRSTSTSVTSTATDTTTLPAMTVSTSQESSTVTLATSSSTVSGTVSSTWTTPVMRSTSITTTVTITTTTTSVTRTSVTSTSVTSVTSVSTETTSTAFSVTSTETTRSSTTVSTQTITGTTSAEVPTATVTTVTTVAPTTSTAVEITSSAATSQVNVATTVSTLATTTTMTATVMTATTVTTTLSATSVISSTSTQSETASVSGNLMSTSSSTPSSSTSTISLSTMSSTSTSSSTIISSTTTSATSITSTMTTYTSTTHTSSTITVTYLEGFDYISGKVEFLVSDCAVVSSDLGRELLRQSLAQAAEVNASYITVQVQCEVPGRRLQVSLTTAYGSYDIAFPERSPELFPVAMVKLEKQQTFLQESLDTALVGTGLVVLVVSAEVTSGPAPSSTSTTTLCPGLPTCMGKGKCERLFNWQCVCEDTYNGLDCSERICPSCQNNGSCLEGGQDLESLWTCDCPEPFVGRMCEFLQCPGDCNDGGDCDNTTGRCTCLTGFKGHDCSVKDVPLTNAIEILLVFGLKGYQATNRSAPSYDTSVRLLDPVAQVHMLSACREARKNTELRVKDEMPCWIEAFETFMISRGGGFPVNDTDLMAEAFQAFLYLSNSADLGYRRDVRTAGVGFDGDLIFTRLRMKVNMAVNAEKSERRELRRRWEDYVEMLNSRAPAATGQALMISKTWTSMELEDNVFASTITAFSLSLMTSLVAVTLFTRNIPLAFYVCCTILLVVCVLSGCLLNFHQYDFGVVEAIGATVFVGLSVDYCLHLAHGYFHAAGQSRAEKLHHALMVLTPSILGGAVTTVAACAFLLPCRMILFRKLGWTLMLNATISIVYTFTFLAPLLLIAGPRSARSQSGCCGRNENSVVAPEVPESIPERTETHANSKDGSHWRQTEKVPEPPIVVESASASDA